MSTTDVSSPRTVAEFIRQSKENPIKWLIPGVLMEGGIHILHGKEETFKTMFTLQMHEALATCGSFLCRPVDGFHKTGIAQLEQKPNLFGLRLERFFPETAPEIAVLPVDLRSEVLGGRTPRDRIGVIADWAEREQLEVVSIDSAVKLFPPRFDLSKPEQASEVFNCLQQLKTVWIVAHDRKPLPGTQAKPSNEEIVGSGRFAQDPDVVHQMIRPDARAPMAVFYWGKVREGEKDEPVSLWFDVVDFRLYLTHPFLHLVRNQARTEAEIVAEAFKRFRWKERRARDYIRSLKALTDNDGNPCVSESMDGHSKVLQLRTEPEHCNRLPESDDSEI